MAPITLTVADAARVIGLSKSTISELARSGTIPSLRVGGAITRAATTLARHARIWAHCMQMWGSSEAVEEKMQSYLSDFGLALGAHLNLIDIGVFRPEEVDVLVPWAGALILHGRFWDRRP